MCISKKVFFKKSVSKKVPSVVQAQFQNDNAIVPVQLFSNVQEIFQILLNRFSRWHTISTINLRLYTARALGSYLLMVDMSIGCRERFCSRCPAVLCTRPGYCRTYICRECRHCGACGIETRTRAIPQRQRSIFSPHDRDLLFFQT